MSMRNTKPSNRTYRYTPGIQYQAFRSLDPSSDKDFQVL